MTSTFSAWRSEHTVTAGGIVLSHRDFTRGAGWGLLDCYGAPKAASLALAEVCSSTAVLPVDLGLDGLHLQPVDDRGGAPRGSLRVAAYTDQSCAAGDAPRPAAETVVDLGPLAGRSVRVEEFMGFRDLTWAWRFGPPAYTIVRATWHTRDGERVTGISWPVGPLDRLLQGRGRPAELVAEHAVMGGELRVTVRALSPSFFVHLDAPGWTATSGWWHLAPGESRTITASRCAAVPLDGPVRVRSLASAPIHSTGRRP